MADAVQKLAGRMVNDHLVRGTAPFEALVKQQASVVEEIGKLARRAADAQQTNLVAAIRALAEQQTQIAAKAQSLAEQTASSAAQVEEAITEQETRISNEVLAVSVNEGDPPTESADTVPTLNDTLVHISLTRADKSQGYP